MEDSIADGICDDANNNVECYFDGGDCCFNLIAFCDECICYYGNRKVTIDKVLSGFFKSLRKNYL